MGKKTNYKKNLCKRFNDGICAMNKDCQYAHGVQDLSLLEVPTTKTYKKEVCERGGEKDFCPLGAACLKTHKSEDSFDGYCALYRLTKRCYFPKNCKHEAHPAATPAAPYIPNRSKFLRSLDMAQDPLEPGVVQAFLFQLCKDVADSHSHGVLHRDLEPQNLLDKEKGILKVADLGLGRSFSVPLKGYTHEIVTLWYRAPEVLLGSTSTHESTTAVDMWSVGCIFAEMARRRALFPGDSEFQQLLHIFRLLGTPTEKEWPGVSNLQDWHVYPRWEPQDLARAVPSLGPVGVDLLSKMLKYAPGDRISAKEALDHPYFDSLHKS